MQDYSKPVSKEAGQKLNTRVEGQLNLLELTESFRVEEETAINVPVQKHVPIPNSMESIKSSNIRLEPMIFWALVEIRARGQKLATASEVERIINQYLVDDHSKVEPTNIARKLRSQAMQEKPWLVTRKTGVADKKVYGLSEDWELHWGNVFDEESPNLS